LCSFDPPVQRRRFDENGMIMNSLEGYPRAMREFAAEEQVALLDLEPINWAFPSLRYRGGHVATKIEKLGELLALEVDRI
jgi:hypothetical protein